MTIVVWSVIIMLWLVGWGILPMQEERVFCRFGGWAVGVLEVMENTLTAVAVCIYFIFVRH